MLYLFQCRVHIHFHLHYEQIRGLNELFHNFRPSHTHIKIDQTFISTKTFRWGQTQTRRVRLYPSSFIRSTFWCVIRLLRSHSKHLQRTESMQHVYTAAEVSENNQTGNQTRLLTSSWLSPGRTRWLSYNSCTQSSHSHSPSWSLHTAGSVHPGKDKRQIKDAARKTTCKGDYRGSFIK